MLSARTKLRNFLESDDLPKQMKRRKLPLLIVEDLWAGLVSLITTNEVYTILQDSKTIYEEFGFKVEPSGIGWWVR